MVDRGRKHLDPTVCGIGLLLSVLPFSTTACGCAETTAASTTTRTDTPSTCRPPRIGVPVGGARTGHHEHVRVRRGRVDKTSFGWTASTRNAPALVRLRRLLALGATWSRFSRPRSITKQGKSKVEYSRWTRVETSSARRPATFDRYRQAKVYFTAKSRYRKNKVIKIRATDSVTGMRYINVAISMPDRGYDKTVKGSKASYKLSRRGRWLLRIEAHDWAGTSRSTASAYASIGAGRSARAPSAALSFPRSCDC